MTFSITTFRIMTLSIKGLCVTPSINSIIDNQHNNALHYAEGHVLFIVMLNAIVMSVIMLNVIMLSVAATLMMQLGLH